MKPLKATQLCNRTQQQLLADEFQISLIYKYFSVVRHFMKKLEDKIVSFDNWTQPWAFHEFISNDETLTELELNLFNEIWETAGDFKFWNNSDLILGCKASQMFITKQYNLTDKAITNIVRALSYQWK